MLARATSFEFAVTDCRTRLPFRFGVVTMTGAPLLTVRARIRTADGDEAVGHAADLLVPKWFEKDPEKTLEEDCLGLVRSAREAAAAFLAAAEPQPLFRSWWGVYRDRVAGRPEDASDRLVRGFGVALCERALIDAHCRAAGASFHAAWRDDLFGFDAASVHEHLAGWSPAGSLDPAPASSIELRHTVGMVDALRSDDVPASARLDDGFPEALEEDVRRYGLTCFKLKLCGDAGRDTERLLAIAAVLRDAGVERPRVTVDGNEQFADAADVLRLFERLEREELGRWLLHGLLYVEQPLARARSLEASAAAGLRELAARTPVILDEADTGTRAFPRALELGYRGISVKNCKGVFRAMLNRGVAERAGDGAFQAGEDLTNLPLLPLQQDLATAATLGLPHVERNGHHYFRGLAHLPGDEVREALERHDDLYVDRGRGAELRVDGGRLALGSLDAPGYGTRVETRLEERTALDDWAGPDVS